MGFKLLLAFFYLTLIFEQILDMVLKFYFNNCLNVGPSMPALYCWCLGHFSGIINVTARNGSLKKYFFSAPATKRGGSKGLATKKKNIF